MKRKLILRIETLLLSAAFVTAGAKTVGAQQAIMQEEEAAQPVTEQAEPQLTAESPEDFASVSAGNPTVITEESASTTASDPNVITEEPASAPASEPTAITEEPTSTTASDPNVITEEPASATAGNLTAITEEPTSTTPGEPTGTSESAESPESPAQDKALASVSLKLAQELQTVPSVFLDCLKDLEVYTVTLVYSDGTEELLDKEDSRYTLSVEYEDETDTEDTDTVHRTYHATVKETATGKEYEDTQNVILGSQPPSEIKTTEITTLTLEKEKKWLVVQSTPDVTGRYILNSDKVIKNIYYTTESGEVVCTEDILNLQQGLLYTFLIVLN